MVQDKKYKIQKLLVKKINPQINLSLNNHE